MGYTEQGEPCEVYFTRSGSAEDYYAPGTYIKISKYEGNEHGKALVAAGPKL